MVSRALCVVVLSSFPALGATPSDGFSFVAYGDTRSGEAVHAAIVDRILEIDPDFVLFTGDIVNSFEQDTSPQWEKFKELAAPLLSRKPPDLPSYFFPAVGNHEVGDLDVYFSIFNTEPVNRLYYSFTYRNAHFIALYAPYPGVWRDWDPAQIAPGSEQYVWLEEDLKQAAADPDLTWLIVFFHAPLFSCSRRSKCGAELQKYLLPLFEKYSVDVVINGHAHSYQRFGPLKNYTVDRTGTTYILTAGGGAPIYDTDLRDCNAFSDSPQGPFCDAWTGQPHRPVSAVFARAVYHFVKLQVEETRIMVDAVDPEGKVFDRFVISKEPTCGDNLLDPGEECDDGNLMKGDGCSCTCLLENHPFVRGDPNGDGKINLADALYILSFLFSGLQPPNCMDTADANDDGKVNLSDAIYLLGYLFGHKAPPPPPFPEPALDPTQDPLLCAGPGSLPCRILR